MKTKIELGDTVQCIYTGFKGIAVARTEFVNGCIQFTIAAKFNPKELISDMEVDSESLKIVKKGKRIIEEEEDEEINSGGASRKLKRRGY